MVITTDLPPAVEITPDPPAVVDADRLDLRTDEAVLVIAEDTPAPLTARRLASVRRAAGAALFPDGRHAPDPDDNWDSWAAGRSDTDTEDRLTDLDARLQRREPPRLAAHARRLLHLYSPRYSPRHLPKERT